MVALVVIDLTLGDADPATTEGITMSDKPSYLSLLNAISLGEGEAECYLNCWAETTTDDAVRQVIATVALREGEHSKAFAKRMCELGYTVKPKESSDVAAKMAIASSRTLSDKDKFEKFGIGTAPTNDDFFTKMFADASIDIQTGALLGRYIAEERDSGRMLAGCYAHLSAQSNGSSAGPTAADTVNAGLDARLGRIEELLERLCSTMAANN